jgi:hypothetical protein
MSKGGVLLGLLGAVGTAIYYATRAEAAEEETAVITGEVVSEDDLIIQGVAVKLVGEKEYTAATDNQGLYTLNAPIGEYESLIFTKAGYADKILTS